MMCPTWVLTVASEMCSSAAISVFDKPEPTSVSTSRSRAVSSARSLWVPSVGGRCGRKRPIRRRVVEGATTESPLCTLRMAYSSSSGGADLSRNPLVAVAVAECHLRRGIRAGVLADVGEGLLHDPVRRERQAAGQRPGGALGGVAHEHAGLSGLGHQVFYLGRGGSWSQRRRLGIGTQDPEQAAHLRQGLAAGAADLVQGLARLRGCGVEGIGAAIGL